MTTPADTPRSRLLHFMQARLSERRPMPWEERAHRMAGVPRSGATGKWYSGITPWLLWCEGAQKGWEAGVWHTAHSADATVDGEGVKMGRSVLYTADRLGLQWPQTAPDTHAASHRVDDLLAFIGVVIRPGAAPSYNEQTSVIFTPAAGDFARPDDRDATLLELLVRWTRDERRLDRDQDELEPLIASLGGALLSATFRVDGVSNIPCDWAAAIAQDGAQLFEAIPLAERAVEYLLDLAHPALRTELRLLDADGEAPRAEGAGRSAELVTSLSQALLVDEDDLRDDEDDEDESDRTEPLILAEAAGKVLHDFLLHFAGDEPSGRKNPPLSAWLSGGPGTGRNQVVAALNALFRTGGTDLGGTLVRTEGDDDLLALIERVWSDENLMVLPAQLPSRVRVTHDRAVATACLRAFHIRFGLSPHLWVARLEHRLLRSGEYADFVAKFEERTGRSWRGDGHRNPEANKEAIVAALGGADKGARRRVRHYEKTRQTASWEALKDEAEWSLFHLRPGELEPERKVLPNAHDRRVLFVLDLSSALASEDPVARGWLRRCLAPLPARFQDMARPSHRPFWFLMTPDVSLKELAELVHWDAKLRRKQQTVDLDQSPVTAAVGTDLLGKDPAAMGPVFKLYARDRDAFDELLTVEGLNTPRVHDRDEILATFPFLPCLLPMAQAVLDTFGSEREAKPLQVLVRKALDEQYYAPADRFVPLDRLLEPIAPLLETSSSAAAAPAGVRIFVGGVGSGPAVVAMPTKRAAFTHETVLQTVRWANRVRNFPCTAPNLVPLMLSRLDRPIDEMIAEVEATLAELVKRESLRKVKGPQAHRWVRGL